MDEEYVRSGGFIIWLVALAEVEPAVWRYFELTSEALDAAVLRAQPSSTGAGLFSLSSSRRSRELIAATTDLTTGFFRTFLPPISPNVLDVLLTSPNAVRLGGALRAPATVMVLRLPVDLCR